jgi:opacity protein-like surface antigen
MYLRNCETKKTALGLTVAALAALLANRSQAQSDSKFYLDVKTGVSLPQDLSIQSGSFGSTDSIKFETGLRADVGVGYNLCPSFAVELATGVIWNSVRSIAGNPLSDYGASADLYQIPLMVNGIYNIPLHGNFKPYIGVGVGGVIGELSGSNIPLFYYPGANQTYSDVDFTFAYQATVGFKYSLGPHAQIGLTYEFLGTTDHSWTDQNVPLKTDGTQSHSIMATFTWRF